MTPNYDRAATAAIETLIKYNINSTPVNPMNIIRQSKNAVILSFAEMGDSLGEERKSIMSLFGDRGQDAVATVHIHEGKVNYIVSYNQRLPFYMLQRALARELGHIILKHDGSLPEDVRMAEAYCFAHHLLCPRPLIKLLQATNIRITTEVLGNLTGCYERCLTNMRRIPETHVQAELNRTVSMNFRDYFQNFFEFQRIVALDDVSAVADFGSFMDGYEE